MRIGSVNKLRLILASIVTVGASLTVYGQVAAERDEQADKREAVRLTLSTLESSICANRPLSLKLQIENVGQAEIKIDRADLWSSFSYSYLTRDSDRLSGRGGGMGTGCSHCRGNYISLLPGTARWEKHEFNLNNFFQDEGDYSLRTGLPFIIGDKGFKVESNEIEFEVRPCGSN